MDSTKTITLQYFALFREQRGMASETISTSAMSLRDLYGELQKAHGFSLPMDSVRVAVNDEFADWNTPVTSQAKVVFIPPVAGG